MAQDQKLINRYLTRESSFKHKWLTYLERKDLKLPAGVYHDKLTPLYGLAAFRDMTESEKVRAYSGYVQFMAEIQLFLEKVLVYAFYIFRKKESSVEPSIRRSMHLLAKEELYHTTAYMHFLRMQNPEQLWFIDRVRYRKAAAWCLRRNPLAITLIGAKFESFSTTYLADLGMAIKDHNHPWYQLNKIHMEDEAFHVPLQFDIYEASVSNYGFLRTVLSIAFLFAIFQAVLISGMYRMVNFSFHKRNWFFRTFYLFPLVVIWSSRKNEAYQKSREIVKHHFRKKDPKYRRAMKFLYT